MDATRICMPSRKAAQRGARWCAGTLLLTASIFKIHQLFASWIVAPPSGVVAQRLSEQGVVAAIANVEFALGALLITGHCGRLVWRLTICSFAVFAAISFSLGLTGADSCGCFSVVRVNPWLTFAGDLAAMAALLRFPPECSPPGGRSAARSVPQLLAVLGTLILSIVLGIAALAKARITIAAASEISTQGSTILLEPEKWVGKPFPLSRFIRSGDEVRRGDWTVLLYRSDCPKCQEALRQFEPKPSKSTPAQRLRRVALIELPPFSTSGAPNHPDTDSACVLRLRLDENHVWLAATPAVLKLSNSVVAAVRSESGVWSTAEEGCQLD